MKGNDDVAIAWSGWICCPTAYNGVALSLKAGLTQHIPASVTIHEFYYLKHIVQKSAPCPEK